MRDARGRSEPVARLAAKEELECGQEADEPSGRSPRAGADARVVARRRTQMDRLPAGTIAANAIDLAGAIALPRHTQTIRACPRANDPREHPRHPVFSLAPPHAAPGGWEGEGAAAVAQVLAVVAPRRAMRSRSGLRRRESGRRGWPCSGPDHSGMTELVAPDRRRTPRGTGRRTGMDLPPRRRQHRMLGFGRHNGQRRRRSVRDSLS